MIIFGLCVTFFMLGFIIGIKLTENRFFEPIADMVDLMRIDGAIKW